MPLTPEFLKRISIEAAWQGFLRTVVEPSVLDNGGQPPTSRQLRDIQGTFYAGVAAAMTSFEFLRDSVRDLSVEDVNDAVRFLNKEVVATLAELLEEHGVRVNSEGEDSEEEDDVVLSLNCVECGKYAVTAKGIIFVRKGNKNVVVYKSCFDKMNAAEGQPNREPVYYVGPAYDDLNV